MIEAATLMRRRRRSGSPWTPTKLPNLYRWGEAAKWDGGASYLDLSGNGKTMTKAGTITAVTDPRGFAAMRVDAASLAYWERVGSTTFGPTVISQCINVTGQSGASASIFSADSLTDFQVDGGLFAQFQMRFNTTSLGATTTPITGVDWIDGVAHVFTVVLDAAGSIVRMRVDGVEYASDTLTNASFSTNNFRFLTNRGANAAISADYYGEVINGSVDIAETAKIETYLGMLAGLTI